MNQAGICPVVNPSPPTFRGSCGLYLLRPRTFASTRHCPSPSDQSSRVVHQNQLLEQTHSRLASPPEFSFLGLPPNTAQNSRPIPALAPAFPQSPLRAARRRSSRRSVSPKHSGRPLLRPANQMSPGSPRALSFPSHSLRLPRPLVGPLATT